VSQQSLAAASSLFNPFMAALRERPVSAEMMIALHLGYIDVFFAGCVRPVKVDGFSRHVLVVPLKDAQNRPAGKASPGPTEPLRW
jgi:hypothetical protein